MLPRNLAARAENNKRKRAASRERAGATDTGPGEIQWPVSDEDLKQIDARMKAAWNWVDKEPRPFQMEAGRAQCRGRDVIIHARTGLGKTTVVAAPYAFPENAKRKTIFVSPLIALQEEMVDTFREEYGLAALAVNSAREKPLEELMEEICTGDHNIILISPEMLQSRQFVKGVLGNSVFTKRVLSLVVDEAHCVSHWGADFRKKYGTLGNVRAFLPPKTTSVVAMSATFTPRVRRDVLSKLHFGDDYINLDLGNNRSNVSLVVRAMHRTQTTYGDLDFVIPRGVQTAADIPPTFIYADDTKFGTLIIDHLVELLPASLREDGLIRPFNATHSHSYRKNAMDHFRHGSIRILVCTDAAGMGCNLPNIELVVQWALPDKLSTFVQRAGRAARRPGLTGLAVLLVEPTAYGVHPGSVEEQLRAEITGKAKSRRPPKGWAISHGRKRGAAASASCNEIDRTIKLAVSEESKDEGLLCLVQTGDCRRRVIGDAFNCDDIASDSGVPCCDLCNPELLRRTLPGPAPRKKGKAAAKATPAADIVAACRSWREAVYTRDWDGSIFAASGILGDTLIDKIAVSPPFASAAGLKALIADEWQWWDEYGHALYVRIATAQDARADAADVSAAGQSAAQKTKAPRRAPRDRAAASNEAAAAVASTSNLQASSSTMPRGSVSPPRKRARTGQETLTAENSPEATQSGTGSQPALHAQSTSSAAPPGPAAVEQRYRDAHGVWNLVNSTGHFLYLYSPVQQISSWVSMAQLQAEGARVRIPGPTLAGVPAGRGAHAPPSGTRGAHVSGRGNGRGQGGAGGGRGNGRGRGAGGQAGAAGAAP